MNLPTIDHFHRVLPRGKGEGRGGWFQLVQPDDWDFYKPAAAATRPNMEKKQRDAAQHAYDRRWPARFKWGDEAWWFRGITLIT